ncbi:MAG TPA: ABC transporter ATP-binding protein [Actinomycetota bacterium]|nr:ABC transporter ATP-binding protein [Actinomycetota bacterium]
MAPPRTPDALLAGRTEQPAAAAPAAVWLSGVTRVFGAVPALVRIDLEVLPGEVVLVRGPNGAGKTTLLRVIATALSPTYGRGRVLGFDLLRDRAEIRRRTELVGHRTRLYDALTARENLAFAAAAWGADGAGVGDALRRVGLAELGDERVGGFSQGMRQRVALARALARDPELLLLDEPYAGLDERARRAVAELVGRVRDRGGTTIVASHDPSGATMADRVLHMDAGRLLPEAP